MTLGLALKRVRLRKGLSQATAAKRLCVSRSSLAKWERGYAQVPHDVSNRAIEWVDDPWLILETARTYSGKLGGVRRLDGNVDLHRSSVREKTIEELEEAIEALNSIRTSKQPAMMKQNERDAIEDALIQQIDAIYALHHLVAVFCDEYDFSWKKLWQRHDLKLRQRGYVR